MAQFCHPFFILSINHWFLSLQLIVVDWFKVKLNLYQLYLYFSPKTKYKLQWLMPMLHEYSPIRRSRNWTIMNVQSVLFQI
jgi:hypothetical protein